MQDDLTITVEEICDSNVIEHGQKFVFWEDFAPFLELAEMVMDNTKMPHQHSDLQTRLYCLSERAREVLKR